MEILQVCRQLSHVLIMKSPEQILSFLFHLELYYFLLVLLSVLNLACTRERHVIHHMKNHLR